MSEEPAKAAEGTAMIKPHGEVLSGSGFGDDVGTSMLAYLEPTKLVARTLFEHAPVAMLMVDQAGKIKRINSATEKLFGYSREALAGQSVETLVPLDAQVHHGQLRHGFMAHPISRSMAEGRRLAARTKDGTEVAVNIAMNPVVLDSSEVAVILSVIDNSARERADRAELFVKELTHRARNMFAIISAISRQIAKYSTSIAEFQVALDSRLNALSTSYQVFEKENWQAAPIRDLVRSQISFLVKQDTPQIDLSGPKIRLQPTCRVSRPGNSRAGDQCRQAWRAIRAHRSREYPMGRGRAGQDFRVPLAGARWTTSDSIRASGLRIGYSQVHCSRRL